MLEVIESVVRALEDRGVRYCHWKSNATLGASLMGEGDLDILVDPRDRAAFADAVRGHGFVPVDHGGQNALHFVGLDERSGRIVDLHTYFEIVTGGALVKTHSLRLETQLLESGHRAFGIRVPSPAAELALLVVRKAIESTSPLEHMLLIREFSEASGEVAFLRTRATDSEASAIAHQSLGVSPVAFGMMLHGLQSRRRVCARVIAGWRICAALRGERRISPLRAELTRMGRLARLVWQRRVVRCGTGRLESRGAVIAIVGPEGSGKSTIVARLRERLSAYMRTHAFHAGKPPTPIALRVIAAALPVARRLAPRLRSSAFASANQQERERLRRSMFASMVHGVRSLWIAHDRAQVVRRAHRLAARGEVALFDRYPAMDPGAIDGPQLLAGDRPATWRKRERAFYESVPPADGLIICEVALETALVRNEQRKKRGGPEPREFIIQRHVDFRASAYASKERMVLDTSDPVDISVVRALAFIWRLLVAESARASAGTEPGYGPDVAPKSETRQ